MKQTPLYEAHKKLGAKMVEFGGWMMPVSYSGVIKEHHAVRQKAGLFDICHMGEIFLEGPEVVPFLQWVTCNDVNLLKDGACQYTLLMRPNGGLVDDVILHRRGENRFFFCVNASNTQKDFDWLLSQLSSPKPPPLGGGGWGEGVKIENKSDEFGMLALQGPLSQQILQPLLPAHDLSQLPSFHFLETTLQDKPVFIARTGYTGEEGFEIYSPSQNLLSLWETLLKQGAPLGLIPCGLGARDTLRLEMAYPLYGHELNDEITPLEASLAWVVKMNKGDFIGKDVLLRQKEEGLRQKRVGFVLKDEGIPRAECPIFSGEEKLGWVSSGGYSPSLDKSIGCGYLPTHLAKTGTALAVEIRGKKKMAEVVATPFYRKSF